MGMGNFSQKFRGTDGFGFSLTGYFGAGSKILPREGLFWWGGAFWPRDLTQKLRGIERREKKRSIALNKYNRKYFRHFFAQVN